MSSLILDICDDTEEWHPELSGTAVSNNDGQSLRVGEVRLDFVISIDFTR